MANLPKIAVLVSGDGSNFEALVQASRSGVLQAEIVGVVSSRAQVPALERAARLKVPARVLNLKTFPDRDHWDQALLKTLEEWKAEWVALAGFLSLIGPRVLSAFEGKIVNIHPSLLPAFGGPGMYGTRVLEAVLAARVKETGITIHRVTGQYDEGEILAQARIPIGENENLASLSARVRAVEHEKYPRVLNDLVWGRLTKTNPSGSPKT